MAETLNNGQISAAVLTLRAWSNQPWSDDDTMVWRAVLRNYLPGELGHCLDQWQQCPSGRFRPRPGDLAQYLRRKANHTPHQDYVPPPPEAIDIPAGLKALREIRSTVRGGPKTVPIQQGDT